MYLDLLIARGGLDGEVAEDLCAVTTRFTSKIVLVFDGRRVSAQCLPLCWESLAVTDGTEVPIEVYGGYRGRDSTGTVAGDLEDRRALVEFSEAFGRLTATVPAPARHRRRWFTARSRSA
ncbi:hypothetical protein [Jongsikchunia kroppenstedtii]|uniref:hypothetical protein n=1 Tax=Jongsikchunia kroppenstedtii TaxID=1121721 RepID=UPI00035F6FB5|nr:hypothetical protein [Jongsikchunia kroppenstedtii]